MLLCQWKISMLKNSSIIMEDISLVLSKIVEYRKKILAYYVYQAPGVIIYRTSSPTKAKLILLWNNSQILVINSTF